MKENIYPQINEKTYTHTLSNGLRICVIPKPEHHKKFAILAINYGSSDAKFLIDGRTVIPPKGVAHFLEHKVFEQPDGGNALKTFAQTGASPNAFTSRNMTAYYFSCTEHFDKNLEILLDFVTTPYFTDENVLKEQGIIGQEISMVNDDPYHSVMDNMLSALYVSNPAGDSIIGTKESIGQITRQTLFDCYNTFYTPSNMALVVAGAVDAEKVIATASEMLDKAPPKTLPTRFYGDEPESSQKEYIENKMQVNLPVFAIGFKANIRLNGEEGIKNRLVSELAMELLAGDSSKLHSELYEDGIINKQFGAGVMFFPGSICALVTGESSSPETVKEKLISSAKEIIASNDEKQFLRIKRMFHGMSIRAYERFESVCRKQCEAIFNGYDLFESFNLIEKITFSEAKNMLSYMIKDDNFTMSVVKDD